MTFEVPALAAGFASQFDTIGPYVGFGSLIAVVAMAVLVFSQGRELQRLRDWAGTSPERLDALEQQLQSDPRYPGRVPGAAGAAGATAGAPRPGTPGVLAPHPGAQTTGNAGAAPPPRPGTPVAGASTVGAAGVAGAAGAAGGPPRPVPPVPVGTSTNPQATRVVPALAGTPRAATAAGRAATSRQREEPPAPKRSVGQIVGVGVVALVVLVGILFAVGVIGGGGDSKITQTNKSDVAAQKRKRTAPTYSPAATSVTVLNASGRDRVAKSASDILDNKRFATAPVGDYTEAGARVFRPTSQVAYRSGRGNRDAARDVARFLKLKSSSVTPMTSDIRASVDGTPKIVVILGSDYAAKASTAPADTNPSGPSTSASPPASQSGAASTGATTPQADPQSTSPAGDGTAAPDDTGAGTAVDPGATGDGTSDGTAADDGTGGVTP